MTKHQDPPGRNGHASHRPPSKVIEANLAASDEEDDAFYVKDRNWRDDSHREDKVRT